jgi:hypothetical protein
MKSQSYRLIKKLAELTLDEKKIFHHTSPPLAKVRNNLVSKISLHVIYI